MTPELPRRRTAPGVGADRHRMWCRFRMPGRIASLAAVVQILGATPGQAQDRFVVLEEPTGTAVGVAIVINGGGAWELPGQSGLAYLSASAILEQLRPILDSYSAYATVSCGRGALEIRLVTPPQDWAVATRSLLDALFAATLSDAAFGAARERLAAQLAAENGSPASVAATELDRALFGPGSRWAEPPCGDASTVAGFTAEDARRWARSRFTEARTTVAVAGPVDMDAARSVLRESLATLASPVALPQPSPPPAGRDITIRENVVSAWVSMAFPIRGAPREGVLEEAEALEFLAYLLRETTGPSTANADVFDREVRVERFGGGGAVVIRLVTLPDRGAHWADRIRNTVADLARGPLPHAVFDPLLRRYVGERLMDLSSPEARALDAARQLLLDGAYVAYHSRLAGLSPQLLHRAAIRLGDPAIAIISPD